MGTELLHGDRQTATMNIKSLFANLRKMLKKLKPTFVFSSELKFWGKREKPAKGRKTENKRAETTKCFVYIGKGTLK